MKKIVSPPQVYLISQAKHQKEAKSLSDYLVNDQKDSDELRNSGQKM
jgi:ABC-type Fe3+ transport system substrate-binding protein